MMPKALDCGDSFLSITYKSCAPENESQRDSDIQPKVAATLE